MFEDVQKNPIMWTDVYNTSHTFFKESVEREVSHIYNRKSGMFLYGFNHAVLTTLTTKIEEVMVEEAQMFAENMGMPFPTDVDECCKRF